MIITSSCSKAIYTSRYNSVLDKLAVVVVDDSHVAHWSAMQNYDKQYIITVYNTDSADLSAAAVRATTPTATPTGSARITGFSSFTSRLTATPTVTPTGSAKTGTSSAGPASPTGSGRLTSPSTPTFAARQKAKKEAMEVHKDAVTVFYLNGNGPAAQDDDGYEIADKM